jgi:hypothetical protein
VQATVAGTESKLSIHVEKVDALSAN